MGNYNPHRPSVLGMELVPISQESRDLDLFTELGYGFTVTGAPYNSLSAVTSILGAPASAITGQTMIHSVYPRGREDDTGEIKVVRMSLTSAFVTGASAVGGSLPTVLQSPADATGVSFSASSHALRATFDTAGSLTGKRILGVDLVYQAAGTPGFALEPTIESNTVIYRYGPYITGPASLTQVADLGTVRFGDVNPWWSTANGPNATADRMPWRYTEMQRWSSAGTGGQLFIGIRVNTLPLSGVVTLGYLAVDVYYCEESRVAYGAKAFGQDPTGTLTLQAINSSTSTSITMREPAALATPVTLSSAEYTITTSLADAGDKYNAGDRIKVKDLYQLHGVPITHPTYQVAKFLRPVAGRPAVPPVRSDTAHLVGVGMIDASLDTLQFGNAPVTYEIINGGPVYRAISGTSITVTQPIHNVANPASTFYDYVRFYARRFNPAAPGNLTVTIGAASVTLTPAEFVALDEVVLGNYGDGTGWKEITLPLLSQFTSDGSFQNVVFSMTGVTSVPAIDQWQILITRTQAPDFSGAVPASFLKSRYDGIQNASATWLSDDFFTVPTVDTSATAVVMVAQSPVPPDTITVDEQTQALTEVSTYCGSAARCSITALNFFNLSWIPPQPVIIDTASRTVTGGWGNAQPGNQAWTVNTAGSMSVRPGYLSIATSTATLRIGTIGSSMGTTDIRAKVWAGAGTPIANVDTYVFSRYQNSTNYYALQLRFSSTGTIELRSIRVLAGVTTGPTAVQVGLADGSENQWNVHFRVEGNAIRSKAWLEGSLEPTEWQSVLFDNTWSLGSAGLGAQTTSGTLVEFSSFALSSDSAVDGYYELQRYDDVDGEWYTIMKSEDETVTQFNDYEARVGVSSSYRIRAVTALGFEGEWSSEFSALLNPPGVVGTSDGVLIFTSNIDPTRNLAYVMVWDGNPEEEFAFPEAGFTQLRTQYGRDYFTAFRPTERGGDSFTRDILVNAAAIAPEVLPDMHSLRDLAWAQLPYVCVRDEKGDRWFANVLVPSERVRMNRRLYFASITVTRLTDTPAPGVGF